MKIFNVTNLGFGRELNDSLPEIQFGIRIPHVGIAVSCTAVLPSILLNPSYTVRLLRLPRRLEELGARAEAVDGALRATLPGSNQNKRCHPKQYL